MTKSPAFGPQLNRHLTIKQAEITGRRFCSSHQGMAPTEGGKLHGSRWCCATCTAKRINRTPFTKKESA